MVPKKDASWRPCGDYHRLSTITVRDRYPLPNMMDLTANMDGCTVFSKIDLVKAFHQIAPEDRQKTAVITPFGLFEYNYMPFGLCNAAQTLQKMQDQIFKDLPCTFVYLDYQGVASRDMEQHVADLRAVSQCLADNGFGHRRIQQAHQQCVATTGKWTLAAAWIFFTQVAAGGGELLHLRPRAPGGRPGH
jgi:cytoskeleton-associated protein 5